MGRYKIEIELCANTENIVDVAYFFTHTMHESTDPMFNHLRHFGVEKIEEAHE